MPKMRWVHVYATFRDWYMLTEHKGYVGMPKSCTAEASRIYASPTAASDSMLDQ